jgi:hypothetical protein
MLGNDAASVAHYFNELDMGSGAGLIVSNPSERWSVAGRALKLAFQAHVTTERLVVSENASGTPYVSKVLGGALGNTAWGAGAKTALGIFSILKGGYDAGTLVGAFAFACGGR